MATITLTCELENVCAGAWRRGDLVEVDSFCEGTFASWDLVSYEESETWTKGEEHLFHLEPDSNEEYFQRDIFSIYLERERRLRDRE